MVPRREIHRIRATACAKGRYSVRDSVRASQQSAVDLFRSTHRIYGLSRTAGRSVMETGLVVHTHTLVILRVVTYYRK